MAPMMMLPELLNETAGCKKQEVEEGKRNAVRVKRMQRLIYFGVDTLADRCLLCRVRLD